VCARPSDRRDRAAESGPATRIEVAHALERCLDALAPSSRLAVLLRYREGFSYREMAEICCEPPTTLQRRVAGALLVLRRCLEGRPDGAR
jgi:RNA polymerase sigma-70 factor (ECF subfamily)